MGMALPPRYRRILKKGDFNTPSDFSFFIRETAAEMFGFNRRDISSANHRC